jgi:uncharacterized membrane protein
VGCAGAVWERGGNPTTTWEVGMSNLVAIAYPDRDTAEQVRRTLLEMQKEHIIELDDMAVVTRSPEGKVKLHQGTSLAGAGAAGGALWGGVIGLLFLAPLLGMAVGAAAGGAAGHFSDVGVDDNFMKDLGAKLQEGGAAVIVLVRRSTPDKVLPRIQEYGGQVLQTSLSAEAEEDLKAAIGEQAPA